MMVPRVVMDDLEALGLELAPAPLELLARYLDALLDANTRINLTAVRQRDLAWQRLILDSLTLAAGLEPIEPGGRVIDVGTGGGLPGIPLAIVRPDLRFTLLDATGKKVRFLEQCVRELGLENVTPLHGRAEDVGRDPAHRERCQAAVTRAVGSVSEVLEYCLPLVEVGGRALIIKGAAAESEVAAGADALSELGAGEVALIDGYPPGGVSFESELVIVSVIKARPTPRAYPRRPGIPRSAPL